MYGYFDLEGDDARRTRYARLAMQLSAEARPVPTRAAVLGSPAWTSDLVRIQVTPRVPLVPPLVNYFASGTSAAVMSDNLPVYQGPDFRSEPLSFECQVLFAVDDAAAARPSPFVPPRASVLFEFRSPSMSFRREHRDPRPDYTGAGSGLHTTFPTDFSFILRGNGPLHMRFELVDRDSGVTRVYDDTIRVEANRLRDIPMPGPTRVA